MNAQIETNFEYHPPTEQSARDHSMIRAKFKELAYLVDQTLPPSAGREKAVAQTNLETAMMWACAGIVRHADPALPSKSTEQKA